MKHKNFKTTIHGLFLIAALVCLIPSLSFAEDSKPCLKNPEVHQLDFWLGNWTITHNESANRAQSKVYLSLDQCVVIEDWNNGAGHTGQNVLAYNSEEKQWVLLFADNFGHAHIFQGKTTPGMAEFNGTSHDSNGDMVLHKLKIVRKSENQVEQTWEKSSDNGATWNTVFRGEYRRSQF